MKKTLSDHECTAIEIAVHNALSSRKGWLTAAMDELKSLGFRPNSDFERYAIKVAGWWEEGRYCARGAVDPR